MEKLGIQPIPLLLQGINFLILLLILKKYLYKPILTALAERKKKIEEGLEYSQKTKAEFEKSEKKGEEILSRARSEGQKIIEEAKRVSKKKEAELIEKAEKQAQEIVAKARQENEVLKEELEKDLKREAIEMAERIVERVIKESLTESAHKALIDRKIKEVARESIK